MTFERGSMEQLMALDRTIEKDTQHHSSHYMTVLTMHVYLAKYCLLQHYHWSSPPRRNSRIYNEMLLFPMLYADIRRRIMQTTESLI